MVWLALAICHEANHNDDGVASARKQFETLANQFRGRGYCVHVAVGADQSIPEEENKNKKTKIRFRHRLNYVTSLQNAITCVCVCVCVFGAQKLRSVAVRPVTWDNRV